jgi:hypothetical protein
MWKEAVIIQFLVVPCHLPGGAKKNNVIADLHAEV